MELRHLRYFVAVAEKLHFSRAAEYLNISTPTLSHQIQALETMLGAQLLSRKTKSAVSLTQTGKRFLEEARATLAGLGGYEVLTWSFAEATTPNRSRR
jgi:DNA-binding transcriptional LysR family regulator